MFEQTLETLLSESHASVVERERATFDSMTAPFQRRLILYGAGRLGCDALQALRLHGIEPLAFSDASPAKWGKEVAGLKVMSPEDAARKFGSNAAFVVTVSARGGDFLPILRKLSELSCLKVVPFRSLFWKFPANCPVHLSQDVPSRILKEKDSIRRVFSLLADTLSREEYVSQLRWRLLQDFEGLTAPCRDEQYFPQDIFSLEADEVFIDAGAYDGDTLRAFLQRRPGFDGFVALEPDPTNFARLCECVSGLPDNLKSKVLCKMVCIGARKEIIRFQACAGKASQISEEGEVEVQCETLDEIFSDCRPTFIKMDIEGAELDALQGAQGLLQRSEAIWAVCVYHKSEHLWQLPAFIADHSQRYRFFLRKYAGEIWETVCYAVPEKRLCQRRF